MSTDTLNFMTWCFLILIFMMCCFYLYSRLHILSCKEHIIKQVVDVLPDILVFIKDPGGKFIYVNEAMCKEFGKTPNDFLHSPSFLKDEDTSILKNGIVEQDFKEINGKFFSTVKVPLKDERGQIRGIAFIWKDISAMKLEQEKYSYILGMAIKHPTICPQA